MSKSRGTKSQDPPAQPDAETTPPTTGSDAIAALAALYQGEKTDVSSIFNTAMAMMGVAGAYLVGAIPFVGKISEGPLAWLFLLLLPVPLWLIAVFHSLITINAMSHGTSIGLIETALFEASELHAKREVIGSAAGNRIMDIMQAKFAHRLATVVVYAGVGFLVIGFTAYSLHSAQQIVEHDVVLLNWRVVEIAIVTYGVLAIIVALSWAEGFRIIRQDRESTTHAKDGKGPTF